MGASREPQRQPISTRVQQGGQEWGEQSSPSRPAPPPIPRLGARSSDPHPRGAVSRGRARGQLHPPTRAKGVQGPLTIPSWTKGRHRRGSPASRERAPGLGAPSRPPRPLPVWLRLQTQLLPPTPSSRQPVTQSRSRFPPRLAQPRRPPGIPTAGFQLRHLLWAGAAPPLLRLGAHTTVLFGGGGQKGDQTRESGCQGSGCQAGAGGGPRGCGAPAFH